VSRHPLFVVSRLSLALAVHHYAQEATTTSLVQVREIEKGGISGFSSAWSGVWHSIRADTS
jgi:hypothetical protein